MPDEIPDSTPDVAANTTTSLKVIKEWMTFFIAIVIAVSGIIFWVQNSSDTKFERIERDVAALRTEMKGIQTQNGEILRLIGKLEGKLESLPGR